MEKYEIERYLKDHINEILVDAYESFKRRLADYKPNEIIEDAEEILFYKNVRDKRIKVTIVDIYEMGFGDEK